MVHDNILLCFCCRYVSALTTPARLSPVEFHYPLLPPQVPTFQITSPNTSHALSPPPAAAAYHRDDDQPLLRCPDVSTQTHSKKKGKTYSCYVNIDSHMCQLYIFRNQCQVLSWHNDSTQNELYVKYSIQGLIVYLHTCIFTEKLIQQCSCQFATYDPNHHITIIIS